MKILDLFEAEASKPKTLYCNRPLLNSSDLIEWAKTQGLDKCLDGDDMHVTIAYSKKKVDWSDITDAGDNVRVKGGQRKIKLFGPKKDAVVLVFDCAELKDRWEEFRDDLGTSWDYDDYHSHVTISYDGLPKGMTLGEFEPYQGELHFGPEVHEELDPTWKKSVKETKLDEEVSERDAAFSELANAQRGAPEMAMLRAQSALHDYESGPALGWAMEHVGDITHRMADRG